MIFLNNMSAAVRLYFFIQYPQLRDKLIGYAADLGYDIIDGYTTAIKTIQNGLAFVDDAASAELVCRLAQKVPIIGFLEQKKEEIAQLLKKSINPHCDFETFKYALYFDYPSHKSLMPLDQIPFFGQSLLWDELSSKIRLAAKRDCFILIQGESGTGKELVARAIHRLSHRADKPFVAINCGALPHDLIESELFGYDKGAFTGATHNKLGKFEVAGEGTLFLDEIGDMPMIMQVKLLRVLQEKEFERLGSNQLRPFKARVICATHRCLKTMVADKYFRDDLYYRLNVLPLYLPPLRQRLDDLQLLIEQITHKEGMKITFTTDALELLRGYSWPGNIRELCNILYRADVFFHEKHLTAQEVKTLFDDSVKFSN